MHPVPWPEKPKNSRQLRSGSHSPAIIHLLHPIWGTPVIVRIVPSSSASSAAIHCILSSSPSPPKRHAGQSSLRAPLSQSAICSARLLQRLGLGADIRVQRENTNSSPFCRPPVDAFVPFCRGPKSTSTHLCSSTLAGASVASSPASSLRRLGHQYSSFAASETRIASGQAAADFHHYRLLAPST